MRSTQLLVEIYNSVWRQQCQLKAVSKVDAKIELVLSGVVDAESLFLGIFIVFKDLIWEKRKGKNMYLLTKKRKIKRVRARARLPDESSKWIWLTKNIFCILKKTMYYIFSTFYLNSPFFCWMELHSSHWVLWLYKGLSDCYSVIGQAWMLFIDGSQGVDS